MSSKHSKTQRPEDVTLPPISQIFNVPSSSSSSDFSLPPLREGHEHNHSSQHSSSRNRAYSVSSLGRSSGASDLQGPSSQMKRSRYDQSASGGSYLPSHSHPPPINRSSYEAHSSSNPPRRPSGMVMAEHPEMNTGRPDARYMGASPSGYNGSGPSPYSYVPPPPGYAHFPSHGSSRGQSQSSHMGESQSGSSRGHDYTPGATVGQAYHPDDPSSAKTTKYECSYCGKGFLRPSALKIHIISHTGDKDFVCPEESCGRRFGVRSNMLRHIRLVHQNSHSHTSGEELLRDDWSE